MHKLFYVLPFYFMHIDKNIKKRYRDLLLSFLLLSFSSKFFFVHILALIILFEIDYLDFLHWIKYFKKKTISTCNTLKYALFNLVIFLNQVLLQYYFLTEYIYFHLETNNKLHNFHFFSIWVLLSPSYLFP